jgi:voltage-gated potassium channel
VPAFRRLLVALGLFACVIAGGTLGYVVLEDARVLDALYMTINAVATVGFVEAVQLDDSGRILTMLIIVLGLGSFSFAAASGIEFLLEGHLRNLLGRRRMERRLRDLHGHTIVCGFGRVGRTVADQLAEEGRAAVVVDVDPARLQLAAERHLPYVLGDATHDATLLAAGVGRARGLVACTADDAENVLVALTAKGLNRSVFVVVRLKDEGNESKARRAGADRVIAPAAIGGRRIAALLTRPFVVDFLDVVTHGSRLDLVIEEIAVGEGSRLADASLRDIQVRERYGVTVLAVRGAGQELTNTRPDPSTVLRAGDVLVVIGGRPDLDRLERDAG